MCARMQHNGIIFAKLIVTDERQMIFVELKNVYSWHNMYRMRWKMCCYRKSYHFSCDMQHCNLLCFSGENVPDEWMTGASSFILISIVCLCSSKLSFYYGIFAKKFPVDISYAWRTLNIYISLLTIIITMILLTYILVAHNPHKIIETPSLYIICTTDNVSCWRAVLAAGRVRSATSPRKLCSRPLL